MSRLLFFAGLALALSAGAAEDAYGSAHARHHAYSVRHHAYSMRHHAYSVRHHAYGMRHYAWSDGDNQYIYRGPLAASATTYGRDVVYGPSPTPPSEAWRLTPDDPYVVTSGPVPDTPANRERFGDPLSRTGRLTPPVGD